MKLIDLDAEQDYLLDGKYKVEGTGKPVVKTVHRIRDIIATEYRDDKGLLTRREVGEELVRCKDCIHYDEHTRWQCDKFGQSVNADDYCSYGERKDDEQTAEEKAEEEADDADHSDDLR